MKIETNIVSGNTSDGVCLEVSRENQPDLLLLFSGKDLIAGAVLEQEETVAFTKLTANDNMLAIVSNWEDSFAVRAEIIEERLLKNLENDLSDIHLINILNKIKGA